MHNQRQAFTLIELLVVVAIIAVLGALTVGTIFSSIEGQRRSNTETSMRAVHKVLEQHWAQVIEQAKKEEPSATALLWAGNDAKRAQVIWIKLRLMEAFPTHYGEINPGSNLPPLVYQRPAWAAEPFIPGGRRKYMNSYLTALRKAGYLPGTLAGTGTPNPAEASACLFLALSINRDGVGKLNADTLGSSVIAGGPDGLSQTVDGWGRPLMFYRFPTGNAELQTLDPTRGARPADPLDSTGTLLNAGWLTSPYAQAFASKTNPDGTINPYYVHSIPPPKGAFIVPVLVSMGKDGLPGLDLKDMQVVVKPDGTSDSHDNLFSFSLRLGARGD